MKRWLPLMLFAAVIGGGFLSAKSVLAEEAVVRAVLFYSPTCSHCFRLEKEALPALQNKYGHALVIARVNVISANGEKIYGKVLERFKVPEHRIRVPALVIGESYLVGTVEIPQGFPALIDAGLARGGVAWPDLPGLSEEYLAQGSTPLKNLSAWQFMTYKFKQDPMANGIAVLVLLIMVASLIGAAVITLSSVKAPHLLSTLPNWTIPPLAIIGLALAVYLSYVEVSEMYVDCGPVGDCNAVQSSPYAKLFGVLPIAVIGMGGYIVILALWFFQRFGRVSLRRQARLALWGMGIAGVLFSSYLTFLEPFVIGATCAYCLASAVVLVMILWASILPAKQALREIGDSRRRFQR